MIIHQFFFSGWLFFLYCKWLCLYQSCSIQEMLSFFNFLWHFFLRMKNIFNCNINWQGFKKMNKSILFSLVVQRLAHPISQFMLCLVLMAVADLRSDYEPYSSVVQISSLRLLATFCFSFWCDNPAVMWEKPWRIGKTLAAEWANIDGNPCLRWRPILRSILQVTESVCLALTLKCLSS